MTHTIIVHLLESTINPYRQAGVKTVFMVEFLSVNNKYKIGLLIGRFQPFHLGHLFLIRKALRHIDKLVIGIGSANVKNADNPLSFEQRKLMLEKTIEEEKLKDKIIRIVAIDDYPDDDVWLQKTLEKTGTIDTLIGNNEWVNGIFEKKGYTILRLGFFKRLTYEGEKIRRLIQEGKPWEDRVPKYLTGTIKDAVKKYKHTVIGGTFDHFHLGHKKLIDYAFKISEKVSIAIATGKLFKNKFLKTTIESYETRKKSVVDYLLQKRSFGQSIIFPINDIYGRTKTDLSIEAIIVTKDTFPNALKINELKQKLGIKPLKIVTIPFIKAEDGKIISSERIRRGEIDRDGHNYSQIFSKKQKLILPRNLREYLRQPIGQVIKGDDNKRLETASHAKKIIADLRPTLVVSVGDIVTRSSIAASLIPNIQIIDFKNRRKEIKSAIRHPKSEMVRQTHKKILNQPGTINSQVAKAYQTSLKQYFLNKKPQQIIIDGEEDLTALVAMLLSPLGSVVVYGQIDLGIIVVQITEEKKKEIEELLLKFDQV